MGTVRSGGVDLHYIERGEGEETVVFSHSYLVDHRHFEAQIEALSERYRVIAYDHRDHGESGKASQPYALGDLVRDGVAVIKATDAAPCHWVGLSTGGFVGMRLALWYPELLRRLVLMDTSAQNEGWFPRLKYEAMFGVLRLLGTRPLRREVMRTMFGRTSFDRPDRAEMLAVWEERIAAQDAAGLIRFGQAIFGRDDILHRLPRIDKPTLVIVGEEDVATPAKPRPQHRHRHPRRSPRDHRGHRPPVHPGGPRPDHRAPPGVLGGLAWRPRSDPPRPAMPRRSPGSISRRRRMRIGRWRGRGIRRRCRPGSMAGGAGSGSPIAWTVWRRSTAPSWASSPAVRPAGGTSLRWRST